MPGSTPAVAQVTLDVGRGGLETMCADLAIGIAHRGFRSIVIGLDGGGELEAKLAAGNVEFVSLGGRRLSDPRFHWRLTQILRARRVQAVHSHHFASLLHVAAARYAARVPALVHTEHSLEYLLDRPDYRRTLRWLAKSTSTFAVLGERMRRYYADVIHVSSRSLAVIPNGVSLPAAPKSEEREAARRLMTVGDEVVVGTVGRLAPEKNFPLLLRAFAALPASGPQSVLVLIGDGSERAALEQLAASLGISGRVRFLGWQQQVSQFLPGLDVFALSSHAEGLPLAMLEAMAAGIAVVSTRVGDIPDVIRDGQTGRLVTPDSEPEFLQALTGLVASEAERTRLGHAGRDVVTERYSQESMVDAYLGAYGISADVLTAA